MEGATARLLSFLSRDQNTAACGVLDLLSNQGSALCLGMCPTPIANSTPSQPQNRHCWGDGVLREHKATLLYILVSVLHDQDREVLSDLELCKCKRVGVRWKRKALWKNQG